MYARFHRPGPRKWRIAGLCPGAWETRRGRRLQWSAVLAVWWTFSYVFVGGVHAARINDPLVAVGEAFLLSADSGPVVYRADQHTNQHELKALFESPPANAFVAGVALIRG